MTIPECRERTALVQEWRNEFLQVWYRNHGEEWSESLVKQMLVEWRDFLNTKESEFRARN